jgi:hypothetical protein
VSAPKLYTLTPQWPQSGADHAQLVCGFREAIDTARDIAQREYCTVVVRNEADCHTWHVSFRVRGGRRGAYTTVEVTR